MEENQVLTTNQKILITSILASPILLTTTNPLLMFIVELMGCSLILLVIAIYSIYWMYKDNNKTDSSNNSIIK